MAATELENFFLGILAAQGVDGGADEGSPISACQLDVARRSAVLELRSAEAAIAVLGFNGKAYRGHVLKVGPRFRCEVLGGEDVLVGRLCGGILAFALGGIG